MLEETQQQKKKKSPKLTTTVFRNALRSNLDLTSLADTKAGILISINGFILTVSVTASSFAVHNTMMNYGFIAIILTSLGSIILAVLAVKPRTKKRLVDKEHQEGYESLLYYQDMADLNPREYLEAMRTTLKSTKKSKAEMIKHLHILAAEIKKKYFWLKQAYTFFSVGLIISAAIIIYGLLYVEHTPFYNLSKGNVIYNKNKFFNIFEPSAATNLNDGKILIAEDENGADSFKLLTVQENGTVIEEGKLHLPKHIKKIFKKSVEDIEGVTNDNNIIYAITSHSTNRKFKRKSARERLIMMQYDEGSVQNVFMYNKLRDDLYTKFPTLFSDSIIKANNINIEGLVFDKNSKSLLIGFRSPLKNAKAIIIGIKNPRKVLTQGEKPKFTAPIFLDLNGMGIRDICYDQQKSAFWIISGSASDKKEKFQLWLWDKQYSQLKAIKNHPEINSAEGVTTIDNGTQSALLIVEDNGKKPNKSADYVLINKGTL